MDTTNSIIDAYRELQPDVSRVYIMPSIPAVSAQNPYLQLFYQPIEKSGINLSSSSRLSPAILFRRILGEKSILHHHWFECHSFFSMLNLIYKLKILLAYRLLGGKLVWTVHNLQPHHQRYASANKLLRKIWSKLPNKLHVHCSSAVQEVATHFNTSQDRFFVVPHPPYPVARNKKVVNRQSAEGENSEKVVKRQSAEGENSEKREARRKLGKRFSQLGGLKTPVVLMQGYIAEYKGIMEVLSILQKHPVDLNLIIAGPVKRYEEQYAAKVRKLSESLSNVHFIEGYVEKEDLDTFFNAADYVLLNYRDILHSGGAILAESYGKPIIAPSKGCLKELANARLFSDEEELLKILKSIADETEPDDAA